MVLLLIAVCGLIALFIVDSGVRAVLAPMFAAVFIGVFFLLTMSDRNSSFPLADLGTITVLAILCYTVIPPLQFLFSGMEHTSASAYQLYALAPTPQEFGSFTWWYVVYLLSFVLVYLIVDVKAAANESGSLTIAPGAVQLLLLILISLSVAIFAIQYWYGLNLSNIYDERLSDSYEAFVQMPLLFRQFYGVIDSPGILLILKLGLLLAAFLNWSKPGYRYAVYAVFIYVLISNVLWMGARSELVLISLAAAIMYHRFVKPLRFSQALIFGVILFGAFTIMGLMRGSNDLQGNLTNLRDAFRTPGDAVSEINEFQAVFGGNYDLLSMKRTGLLGETPLQFRFADVIMIVPQQVLPFEKLDIQQWITARSNNAGYFMFNPISQSIIGFGWIELIIRGSVLGFVFAKIKKWYLKRVSSFWATLLYFYILIICYQTIRTTALYVLILSIVFRFVPFYLLVRFVLSFQNAQPRAPLLMVRESADA